MAQPFLPVTPSRKRKTPSSTPENPITPRTPLSPPRKRKRLASQDSPSPPKTPSPPKVPPFAPLESSSSSEESSESKDTVMSPEKRSRRPFSPPRKTLSYERKRSSSLKKTPPLLRKTSSSSKRRLPSPTKTLSPPKEKSFSVKRKRSSVSQKKSPSPQKTPSPKPPSTIPPTPPLSPTVSEPAVNVVPPDPPVPTNLSALARKYGIVHVDTSDEMYMKYLYNRGKSAYTPVDPVFIVDSSSKPEEEFHYREIEHYQRIIFNGFTANELLEAGAYPVLGQEEIPIEDPIHPLFLPRQWQNEEEKDWRDGKLVDIVCEGPAFNHLPRFKGRWMASNPLVWGVLDPLLRLVSRMLTVAHLNGFMDSYLCGEYKPIPLHLDTRNEKEQRDEGPLRSFHRRFAHMIDDQEARDAKDFLISKFVEKLQFSICDGRLDPIERTKSHSNYYAVTIPEFIRGEGPYTGADKVAIQISLQLLLPFLRNDVLVAEKMALRWLAAETFMHELMHAMNCVLVGTPEFPHICRSEPYFEDDKFCELGYAWQLDNAGGITRMLRQYNSFDPTKIYPGFGLMNFPNSHFLWLSTSTTVVLGGPSSVTDEFRFSPYHQSWYPLIHDEEFWTHGIKQFGMQLLKPRTAATIVTHLDTFDGRTGYRDPNVKWEKRGREMRPQPYRGILEKISADELWDLTKEELLALQFRASVIAEEEKADMLEQRLKHRAMVAKEIKDLRGVIAVKTQLVPTLSAQETDNLLGPLYFQLFYKAKDEAMKLVFEIRGIMFDGEEDARRTWASAMGEYFGGLLIRTNRRLRLVVRDVLEWTVDRQTGSFPINGFQEQIADLYVASEYLGGLLLTMKEIMTLADLDEDGLIAARQRLEGAANDFNNTMTGKREEVTGRKARWDEVYGKEDQDAEKRDRVEYFAIARKGLKTEQLINADEQTLFNNSGFELCCQIDDKMQSTSHGLNDIVGRMLLILGREPEYSVELRQLRKKMIDVRMKLDLPPYSFKRYGISAWGAGKTTEQLVKEGVDLETGRKGRRSEGEEEVRGDCESWTDVLDGMVEGSANPGVKRGGEGGNGEEEGETVEERVRKKRIREGMIF